MTDLHTSLPAELSAPSARSGQAPDLTPLNGHWVNTDRGESGGMLRLTVGAPSTVRVYAAADPGVYDWQDTSALAYVQAGGSSQAWSFLAGYDFGFQRTVISAYHKAGILVTTTSSVFTDDSGRQGCWTREFFHRGDVDRQLAVAPVPDGLTRVRDSTGHAVQPVGTDPLPGVWVNFDREATGLVQATIRKQGGGLSLTVSEHNEKDWAALPALALADGPAGGPAVGFLASGEPGGGRTATVCGYLNRGLLTLDTHIAADRGNVMTRTHLYLAEEPA